MPQEYHELPEQVQRNVLACLKVRREQLTNALLMEHYKSQLPTVTDFDWRLKVLEPFTLLGIQFRYSQLMYLVNIFRSW